MRHTALLLATLAFASPAFADTLSVDGHVLTDGDSVAKAYQLLGQPNRIVQNQNRFGATISEDFEYYTDGKTIRITVREGKIEAIGEER